MDGIDPTMAKIERELALRGLLKKHLSDALGVSSQVYNNWRHRGLPASRAADVAAFLEWDVEQLLPKSQVVAIGTAYERDEAGAVLPVPGPRGRIGPNSNISDPRRPPARGQRQIPLISWAHAGFHGSAEDFLEPGDAIEWRPFNQPCSQYTYALTVRGESMWPEYREGDIIYVDPELTPQQGDDVVVRNADTDEVTLKRFVEEGAGRRYLKAMNPHYPEPIRIVTEHDRFCGVVIWQETPRRRNGMVRR